MAENFNTSQRRHLLRRDWSWNGKTKEVFCFWRKNIWCTWCQRKSHGFGTIVSFFTWQWMWWYFSTVLWSWRTIDHQEVEKSHGTLKLNFSSPLWVTCNCGVPLLFMTTGLLPPPLPFSSQMCCGTFWSILGSGLAGENPIVSTGVMLDLVLCFYF